MKISFVKMGLAAAALSLSFTACSDDSSSTSPSLSDGINLDVKLIVNEEDSTILFDEDMNSYCVKDEDSYSIQKIKPFNLIKYRFFGDTLVFFNYDNWDEEFSYESSLIFVGGKAGVIEGDWQDANCYYSYEGEMKCDDDEYESFLLVNRTLHISKDNSVFKYSVRLNSQYPQADGDFTKTKTMVQLLECLNDTDNKCNIGYSSENYLLDVSAKVESTVQELGIQKNSWKKNSANFVLNGKTVDISVKNWEVDLYKIDVSMDVTIDGTTCEFYDIDYYSNFDSDLIEPYCSAENEDYFGFNLSYNDQEDKIKYVSFIYINSTNYANPFSQCVHNAMGYAPSDESVFYKKSAEDSRRQKMRDAKRKFWNAVSRISE